MTTPEGWRRCVGCAKKVPPKVCRCGTNQHLPRCDSCEKEYADRSMKTYIAEGAESICEKIDEEIIDKYKRGEI